MAEVQQPGPRPDQAQVAVGAGQEAAPAEQAQRGGNRRGHRHRTQLPPASCLGVPSCRAGRAARPVAPGHEDQILAGPRHRGGRRRECGRQRQLRPRPADRVVQVRRARNRDDQDRAGPRQRRRGAGRHGPGGERVPAGVEAPEGVDGWRGRPSADLVDRSRLVPVGLASPSDRQSDAHHRQHQRRGTRAEPTGPAGSATSHPPGPRRGPGRGRVGRAEPRPGGSR